MSTNESFAIPARVPRLLEVRQPRTPQRVRLAPAPLVERPLPRLAWASVEELWEGSVVPAFAALEPEPSTAEDRFTIEIPLGSNRGPEPAAELTEAGAR
jgi:hypothetical protein